MLIELSNHRDTVEGVQLLFARAIVHPFRVISICCIDCYREGISILADFFGLGIEQFWRETECAPIFSSEVVSQTENHELSVSVIFK
jgi:hypothetical protein